MAKTNPNRRICAVCHWSGCASGVRVWAFCLFLFFSFLFFYFFESSHIRRSINRAVSENDVVVHILTFSLTHTSTAPIHTITKACVRFSHRAPTNTVILPTHAYTLRQLSKFVRWIHAHTNKKSWAREREKEGEVNRRKKCEIQKLLLRLVWFRLYFIMFYIIVQIERENVYFLVRFVFLVSVSFNERPRACLVYQLGPYRIDKFNQIHSLCQWAIISTLTIFTLAHSDEPFIVCVRRSEYATIPIYRKRKQQ